MVRDYLVIPNSNEGEIISASSAYVARSRYLLKNPNGKPLLIIPRSCVQIYDTSMERPL